MRIVLYALLSLCFSHAFAEESNILKQISSRTEQYAVLRADFTQTKRVAAMKRPLITSGKLLYAKEHGVIWQITQPYVISYILSNEQVIEISSDNRRKVRSVNELPGLAQINRIFRAMIAADTQVLDTYFDTKALSQTNSDAPWQVLLTPKQAQVSRFIKQINVTGNQFVESIQISEASNDNTDIVFTHTEGAQTLNDNELKLFGTQNK